MKDVLIVDDNPDLLPVMVGLPELAGHHVVSTGCFEEGLKLAFGGVGVLDAIRSSPGLSGKRVIIMSGLNLGKECFEKGANGFWQRPFDLEDLLAEIWRLNGDAEE